MGAIGAVIRKIGECQPRHIVQGSMTTISLATEYAKDSARTTAARPRAGLRLGSGSRRTIGVSIFRLPGSIAALLGTAQLVVAAWLLGGIYTMLSANYTAELATMLPRAGGPSRTTSY